MAATGTIALNANSLTVTGSGTKFTTEAQVGGALVTYIGNVPYTFVIDSIASDTALNLTTIYQGSNVTRQSFSLLDRGAYTGVNAELGARTALAIRKANYDKMNWQQLLTVDGDVTVKIDDYSQYTGPSWLSLYNSLSGINDSLAKKANSADVSDALSKKANTSDLGKLAAKSSISYSELNTELQRNSFATRGKSTSGAGVWTFANKPYGFSQYGINIQVNNRSDSSDAAGPTIWQHYLSLGTDGVVAHVRNVNGVYGADKLYGTMNTSTNSSGALVPASPIVRIVNNKNNTRQDLLGTQNDEYTWESDFGLTNDESEGCKISKIETGKYLVTGATSLARDLWQVMDCGNGQGRIIALAEAVESESGIEVRCYKQKYTLTDEGDLTVERGDLIDIPDNTWIDVRLEMPDDSIWNKKQVQPTQVNSTP
ncbi:hypothetical protein [Rosenbergiella epipactidis]|uniref:phage tail fiber protein n=1 Tax=Rosenbergiella epipactidis TaxID=1544694 RepID=UPI001F4D75EB|nr:hypothetical protein [Rosenbergiella epipactidis]